MIHEWLSTFDSNTTIESYNIDIRCFSAFLEHHELSRLRLKDVQRWFSSVKNTVTRRSLCATRSFLKYCYNQGVTEVAEGNLGRCIIVPRTPEIKRERLITKQQCLQAIDIATGNTRLMVKILFYLGLRISECRHLKRKDITGSKSLKFSVLGKGNKRRVVTMGPKMSAAVLPELPKSGYLFPGRNGCITSVGAWKRVKKVMKCVLPHASPHYFRHAFASISLQNGCDLGTVSKQLGHTNLKTTSRYMHSDVRGASCFLE